jgi:hypothetical protein
VNHCELEARVRRSIRWIAVVVLLAPAVMQARQATPPSFQFVSIRKLPPAPCPPLELCLGNAVPSRAPATMNVLPGGRFEARNQTIENLARVAFGFDSVDPALGVVAETKYSSPLADRFDVTAVTDGEWSSPPSGRKVPGELRTMLRTLLEQRFKLKARVASGGRGRFYFTGRLPLQSFEPGTNVLNLEAYTRDGLPASASQEMRFEVY